MARKPGVDWSAPGYTVVRIAVVRRQVCDVCKVRIVKGDQVLRGPRDVLTVHADCVGRGGRGITASSAHGIVATLIDGHLSSVADLEVRAALSKIAEYHNDRSGA